MDLCRGNEIMLQQWMMLVGCQMPCFGPDLASESCPTFHKTSKSNKIISCRRGQMDYELLPTPHITSFNGPMQRKWRRAAATMDDVCWMTHDSCWSRFGIRILILSNFSKPAKQQQISYSTGQMDYMNCSQHPHNILQWTYAEEMKCCCNNGWCVLDVTCLCFGPDLASDNNQ